MRRMRASIGGLMGLVLVAAVAITALRRATDGWAGAVLALALGLLGLALLRAASSLGRHRAFWLGFALFEAGYLILALAPGLEWRPELPTDALIRRLDGLLDPHDRFPEPMGLQSLWVPNGTRPNSATWQLPGPLMMVLGEGSGTMYLFRSARPAFRRTGHGLLAVVAGLIGGVLGGLQWATRARDGRIPRTLAGGTLTCGVSASRSPA